MHEFHRVGQKGKMSPKFIGQFDILDRVGNLAYHLVFPPSLDEVHNVFHVSQLRKYVYDPSHKLNFEELKIPKDAT